MAGSKETPRQKMIGMMYLVLMALLALNVSKDILDAFVVVNEGLENNAARSAEVNNGLYNDFQFAHNLDPDKVAPFWNKALDIKSSSDELLTYIGGIKKELIMKTEDVSEEVADTLTMENINKKENYDTPTHMMIGNSEDGSAGIARELKEKLIAYREKLADLLGNEEQDIQNIGLKTEDKESGGMGGTWEMHHFYHTPLAATITMLTKLENEVRNAEYYAVNKLYKSLSVEDFPVDTVAARVLANNYVVLGEEYKAEVFLAAFSKTKNPDMTVNEETIPVDRGTGTYVIKPNREGIFNYKGEVKYTTQSGEVRSFPFESEYMVAKPTLVVSPTKMNTLYKGITNPISVSVPGIPSENLTVNISGGSTLKKVGKGQYEANISKSSPRTAFVSVVAELESGEKRDMGKMEFRIKNLPKPYAKIGQVTTDGKMTGNELANMLGIGCRYDANFPFDLTAKVTSFQVAFFTTKGNAPNTKITGNRWTEQLKTVFRSLRSGDTVIFQKVRGKGSDGFTHELSNITITIK